MLEFNPLYTSQKIEGILLLNSLLVPFAIPVGWSYIASVELKKMNYRKAVIITEVFMLACSFSYKLKY